VPEAIVPYVEFSKREEEKITRTSPDYCKLISRHVEGH